jgi:hypothetical protein
MDQSVLDALKRWPNVPAVYGWLSLSARGDWRLHPLGDAQTGGPGEGITNPQILGFMGRNYASEANGKWFFQNGPQRVYVRLDAAPYIVHIEPETADLVTHNGRIIEHVLAWFTDEMGQMYAQTDVGAVRIDDRDLIALAQVLKTPDGLNFLDALEQDTLEQDTIQNSSTYDKKKSHLFSDPGGQYRALNTPVPCHRISQEALADRLGFVKNPQAATISPQVS